MTPEEIEAQKTKILKEIQWNIHCMTRKSILIKSLEKQLDDAVYDRNHATQNIIQLMEQYNAIDPSKKTYPSQLFHPITIDGQLYLEVDRNSITDMEAIDLILSKLEQKF